MAGNLQRLKDEGVVDPVAADKLNAEVVAKIEALTNQEMDTIIKFKLQISGSQPWKPKRDGSIL